MFGNKQQQKSGDQSVNIQANTLNIHQGLSVEEVRCIAQETWNANWIQIVGAAKDIAEQRFNEFLEHLLEKLNEKGSELLVSFHDPDMVYLFLSAGKDYARSGDSNIEDFLIEILVQRANEQQRTLTQVVLGEAVQVVPKLIGCQLDTLSIIFLIKYLFMDNMMNLKLLRSFIMEWILPFIKSLRKNNADYQHIEYTNCGKIEISHNKVEALFAKKYPHLFNRGFTQEEAVSLMKNEEAWNTYVVQCLRDSNLWQIRYLKNHELSMVKDHIVRDEIIRLRNYVLPDIEIRRNIINLVPGTEYLFDVWDNSYLENMTLTTVGIALAVINIKFKIGKEILLSEWID